MGSKNNLRRRCQGGLLIIVSYLSWDILDFGCGVMWVGFQFIIWLGGGFISDVMCDFDFVEAG